jgi:hypothetical protein
MEWDVKPPVHLPLVFFREYAYRTKISANGDGNKSLLSQSAFSIRPAAKISDCDESLKRAWPRRRREYGDTKIITSQPALKRKLAARTFGPLK